MSSMSNPAYYDENSRAAVNMDSACTTPMETPIGSPKCPNSSQLQTDTSNSSQLLLSQAVGSQSEASQSEFNTPLQASGQGGGGGGGGGVSAWKFNDMRRKALRGVKEFNKRINETRRDDFNTYTDHQTSTKLWPVGMGLENQTMKKPNPPAASHSRPRQYPVSLVPGQYQDWFIRYGSGELKRLPVNSVLSSSILDNVSNEPKERPPVLEPMSIDPPELLTNHKATPPLLSPGSRPPQLDPVGLESVGERPMLDASLPQPSTKREIVIGNGSNKKSITLTDEQCRECFGDKLKNRLNRPEQLLSCSLCSFRAHPSCLEFTGEMTAQVLTYDWQCTFCKTCLTCGKPHDEDNLMFCDICDRGYHSFCVGLSSIPSGRWVCLKCGVCSECGSREPVPGNPLGQWMHESYSSDASAGGGGGGDGSSGPAARRHLTLCHSCHFLRNGSTEQQ